MEMLLNRGDSVAWLVISKTVAQVAQTVLCTWFNVQCSWEHGCWKKPKAKRTRESSDFSTLVPVVALLVLTFCSLVLCCTVSTMSEGQGCSPHGVASLRVRLASLETWDWTVVMW